MPRLRSSWNPETNSTFQPTPSPQLLKRKGAYLFSPKSYVTLGMILQIPTDLLNSETMQILAQQQSALGSMKFALYLFGGIILLLVSLIALMVGRSNKRLADFAKNSIENTVKVETQEKRLDRLVNHMDNFVLKMNELPGLIATVQTHGTDIAQLKENQSNLENRLL